ncbi:MAG TPA: hypothetical protein PKC49_07370 [Phycisphaerae bacterium]|nr:hypothetical protein [Phycisphaerae bacterium]
MDDPLHEWVERATRLHGPDSTVALHARVRLAEVAYAQEQFETAARVCREILQRQTARLGECHMVCHAARTTLAMALARLGGTSEPAELYLRAIECARQKQPGSILLLITMSDALRYLDRDERAVEGEALAREVSAEMRKYAGGHAEATFDAEVYLAGFLSMQGRFDEAEAAFQTLSGPELSAMPARSRARLRLIGAAHLRRRGHFEQAEQQLRQVVAIVQDIRLGTWDDLPDDIILGFVELYHAWGKPVEHEQYRRLREEPGPH